MVHIFIYTKRKKGCQDIFKQKKEPEINQALFYKQLEENYSAAGASSVFSAFSAFFFVVFFFAGAIASPMLVLFSPGLWEFIQASSSADSRFLK